MAPSKQEQYTVHLLVFRPADGHGKMVVTRPVQVTLNITVERDAPRKFGAQSDVFGPMIVGIGGTKSKAVDDLLDGLCAVMDYHTEAGTLDSFFTKWLNESPSTEFKRLRKETVPAAADQPGIWRSPVHAVAGS